MDMRRFLFLKKNAVDASFYITLFIIYTTGGEKEKKKDINYLNWILKEFSMILAEKSNWIYLRFISILSSLLKGNGHEALLSPK
jgi:hypothetical protein